MTALRPYVSASQTPRDGHPPISVAIITLDEADNLARCLASVVDLCREIVVVDSGSTDGTQKLAATYGARVIEHEWPGYVEQKNFALSQCSQPWVLSLDADEALDEILHKQVHEITSVRPDAAHDRLGYEINRLTWYLGDWVRYCWYPEWRLRLVRREHARWTGQNPHDHLKVTGAVGRLKGHLLHYSYRDLAHHMQQTVRYAQISGEQLIAKGEKVSTARLLFAPIGRFLKVLVLKQGWRDGWRGLLIAYSSAMSGLLKYAFALERQKQKSDVS